MIITSISLSEENAAIWRGGQRQLMNFAVPMLRRQMREHGVRRGVARRYNRIAGNYVIVTTRFTEAEYDALHFVASMLRVSVSLLICRLIEMWQKAGRRALRRNHVTNYEISVCAWNANAGVCTESLLFWRKIPDPENPPAQQGSSDNPVLRLGQQEKS